MHEERERKRETERKREREREREEGGGGGGWREGIVCGVRQVGEREIRESKNCLCKQVCSGQQ